MLTSHRCLSNSALFLNEFGKDETKRFMSFVRSLPFGYLATWGLVKERKKED